MFRRPARILVFHSFLQLTVLLPATWPTTCSSQASSFGIPVPIRFLGRRARTLNRSYTPALKLPAIVPPASQAMMPSTRCWADMVDDDNEAGSRASFKRQHICKQTYQSWKVSLWDWAEFQRDYLATRCRLTVLTPVFSSVLCLLSCRKPKF